MAEALEEGHLNGDALRLWQSVYDGIEHAAHVGPFDVIVATALGPGTGHGLGFLLVTFFHAAIGLLSAETVNGAATRQGDHPAEGLALFRGVTSGKAPDFDKNLWKEIFDGLVVVQYASDDGSQSGMMAAIEFVEGFFATGFDRVEQHFVGLGLQGGLEFGAGIKGVQHSVFKVGLPLATGMPLGFSSEKRLFGMEDAHQT